MKIRNVFLWFVAMLLLYACDVKVDLDNKGDSTGEISVKAYGDNADGSISVGGKFSVEVTAEDNDGVAYIIVDIPSINTQLQTDNPNESNVLKINQSLLVTEIDKTEKSIVYITLEDDKGNIYRTRYRFKIED